MAVALNSMDRNPVRQQTVGAAGLRAWGMAQFSIR